MVSRPRLAPFEQATQASISQLVGNHGVSRFLLDPPYVGKLREAYLVQLVQEDATKADAIATAAVRGEELAGLSVVRFPEWDREHFGFPVGRVEHLIAAEPDSMGLLADKAVGDLDASDARVCSARLSSDALPAIHALESRGFRFLEHTLSPWRSLGDWEPKRCKVTRAAAPADLPAMCAVASRAFRTDRFHKDAGFDPAAANGVYEKWVRTWHDSARPESYSRVLVADDLVVGFIMFDVCRLENPKRRVARIVLNGIDPLHVGRGHGLRMYCDALDYLKQRADSVTSVIATGNVAVVNLYAKLGFRFSSGGDVTLHRWA